MSARILVTVGEETRVVPVDAPVIVGRDPFCTISLDDAMLSRRHAEFVATAFGTRVRDLGSQNGVYVNGVRVNEALLQLEDVVHVASLEVRVAENGDGSGVPAIAPVAVDRGTAILTHPPARRGADANGAPATSPDAGTVATDARDARSTSADAVVAPEPSRRRASARAIWSGRVMLTSLTLGLLAFGLGLLPTLWWHGQQSRAAERREAMTLAGRLAAETARVIETGKPVASAADGVLQLPGVSEALVLSLDGRVLAPASRAGQLVRELPGLKQAPAAIVRQHDARQRDVVEVALPVEANDDARAAIVWLAFNPTRVNDSLAAALTPALLAACGLSLLIGWLVARRTLRSLTRLNDSLDAMLAGQLGAVSDPLGARPVRDLAETLNYLVTRLRASASGDLRRVREHATSASSSAPSPMPAPGAVAAASSHAIAPSSAEPDAAIGTRHNSPARAARAGRTVAAGAIDGGAAGRPADAACLVTNAELRIVSASPACATLLGTPPAQMPGLHLLEAIPNAALADGILRCLGDVTPGGEAQVRVALEDGETVRVTVRRAEGNAAVTIGLHSDARDEGPLTARPEEPAS